MIWSSDTAYLQKNAASRFRETAQNPLPQDSVVHDSENRLGFVTGSVNDMGKFPNVFGKTIWGFNHLIEYDLGQLVLMKDESKKNLFWWIHIYDWFTLYEVLVTLARGWQ
jgi:hypothetical protein